MVTLLGWRRMRAVPPVTSKATKYLFTLVP